MVTAKDKKAGLKKLALSFNSALHPRYPSGSSKGGQFAPKNMDAVGLLAKKIIDEDLNRRAVTELLKTAYEKDATLKSQHPTLASFVSAVQSRTDELEEVSEPEPRPVHQPRKLNKQTLKRLKEKLGRGRATESTQSNEQSFEDITERKLLGEGAHGKVYLTSNGTVYKEGRIGESETRILDRAGQMGISPKLLSQDKEGYEMEFLKDYRPMGEEVSAKGTSLDATGLPEVIAKMHANGILHGDLHWNNVMLGKSQPKVIDFGLSQEINFNQSDSDVKREYYKHYSVIQEIKKAYTLLTISPSTRDHEITNAYRSAFYEIDDGNWLERMTPSDPEDLHKATAELKQITQAWMKGLQRWKK